MDTIALGVKAKLSLLCVFFILKINNSRDSLRNPHFGNQEINFSFRNVMLAKISSQNEKICKLVTRVFCCRSSMNWELFP